jgi:hypothetical protein
MIHQVRGSITLRWGLLFGGVAAIAAIVQGILPFIALSDGANRAASYGIFLLFLALYFAAGLLTVRAGESTTTGAIAGLIVALVSQVVGGLVVVGIVIAAPLAYAKSIGQQDYAKNPAALVLTAVMGLGIALLVYGTFGAALGALGGLLLPGKRPASSQTTGTPGL